MFNLIFCSQDYFLNKAVSESINSISHDILVKIWPPTSFVCTRHVITLNDFSPLNSLLVLAGMTCFAESDIVIILSDLVTEPLAKRFITVNCRLICLPQKSSLEALMNAFVTIYTIADDKPKNNVFLHHKEKKLLLSINKGVSVHALSKNFCLSEKRVSAYKICIMKKMGLSKKLQLLRIINSQDLLKVMSFL